MNGPTDPCPPAGARGDPAAISLDVEGAQIDAKVRGSLFGIVDPVQIGRYRILDRVGQGGMGQVYSAYDSALDRKIAVKIVRSAGSHPARHARLLLEAKALAHVQHANVITIHEVGEHEQYVFIAMEFIAGLDLAQWRVGKGAKADWRTVLRVYCDAGLGLAAVHDKTLIHRDFKPHNVVLGDDGVVKVLDFGLARVATDADNLSHPEQAATLDLHPGTARPSGPLTRAGELLGTPGYMAPEQWKGTPIDERTDQFSFCVALWEALYGSLPFKGQTQSELERSVVGGKVAAPPAETRIPRWLHRALLKGLSVDPAARWPSMRELLAALKHGQTRMRRRAAFYGAIALSFGAAGFGGWRQYERARIVAGCEATGAEIAEIWNAKTSGAIRGVLLDTGVTYAQTTYEKMQPWVDRWTNSWTQTRVDVCLAAEVSKELSLELYGQAVTCLDDKKEELRSLLAVFADAKPSDIENVIRAATRLSPTAPCADRSMLARTSTPRDESVRMKTTDIRRDLLRARGLEAVGRYDIGLTRAEHALTAAEQIGHIPTIVEARLVAGRLAAWNNKLERSEALHVSAFADAGAIGADDVAARAAAELAFTVGYDGARSAEGMIWANAATVFARRLGSFDSLLGANILNNQGSVEQARGGYPQAQAQQEQALAIQLRELGPEHPTIAFTLANLANALSAQGQYKQAAARLEEGLAIVEKTFGADHPVVANYLSNVAAALEALAAYDDVVTICRRSLAIQEAAFGPYDPQVAFTLLALANAMMGKGELPEARALNERALAIQEKAFGVDHPALVRALNNLGVTLEKQGNVDESERVLLRALKILEDSVGPEHLDVASVLNGLGLISRDRNDDTRARAFYERALAIREKIDGKEHLEVAKILGNLANLDERAGNYDVARTAQLHALTIAEHSLGPHHPDVVPFIINVATLDVRQDNFEAASVLLERALVIQEAKLAPTHLEFVLTLVNLASVRQEQGRHEDAWRYLERARAIAEDNLGAEEIVYVLVGLGTSGVALGRAAAVVPLLERAVQLRQQRPSTDEEVALADFTLARALWDASEAGSPDRRRAGELARSARARMQLVPGAPQRQVAVIDAWLLGHPASRSRLR